MQILSQKANGMIATSGSRDEVDAILYKTGEKGQWVKPKKEEITDACEKKLMQMLAKLEENEETNINDVKQFLTIVSQLCTGKPEVEKIEANALILHLKYRRILFNTSSRSGVERVSRLASRCKFFPAHAELIEFFDDEEAKLCWREEQIRKVLEIKSAPELPEDTDMEAKTKEYCEDYISKANRVCAFWCERDEREEAAKIMATAMGVNWEDIVAAAGRTFNDDTGMWHLGDKHM